MLLANLPAHERKLYQLSLVTLVAAVVLGLLAGVIGAGEDANNRPDNWQASELRTGADTLADFTAVTAQSRWFLEGGKLAATASVVDTDEPESFRLLGIIDKGGQRHALFMPPTTEAGRSKLVQLAQGEPLVGDWKIQEITSAKVLVTHASDNETRELLLYGAPAKMAQAPVAASKHKVAAKSTKSADNTGAAAKPKDTAAKAPAKAKPKKDKAEVDKAHAERAEKVAKRKAEAAQKKAQKDRAAKH